MLDVRILQSLVLGFKSINEPLPNLVEQVEASSLLADLSWSLLSINVHPHDGDEDEVLEAATPIVEAVSNILNVSPNVRATLFL